MKTLLTMLTKNMRPIMSNVLFLGPYRQRDGWGRASQDYLSAIMQSKHQVAARPIYLAWVYADKVDSRFREQEAMSFDKIDTIIQNVLPANLEASSKCDKNIGLFYIETNHIEHIGWPRRINMLDEVWVSTNKEKEYLQDSGITTPIEIVKMPIDFSKLDAEPEPYLIPNMEDCFVFYFVGEYTHRKNLMSMITAFHREFGRSEQVRLLIKATRSQMDAQELAGMMKNSILDHKHSLRLYRNEEAYHQEFIITEYITDGQMRSLHEQCDCMIMPSRGESVNRPLMDAMYMGNMAIGTSGTGMDDILGDAGWLVNSYETPVITVDPPFQEYYTARETWREIDIIHLQQCMREAFEADTKEREVRAKLGQQILSAHSYGAVSKRMEELV